jgi:hypothetical protein
MVSWFTARWPIETTFQEIRAHLGFETTRQHVAPSVLRTAPCLLGLFSVICLIYAEHVKSHSMGIRQTRWYVKEEPTFSDAMATVRHRAYSAYLPDCARRYDSLSMYGLLRDRTPEAEGIDQQGIEETARARH